MLTDKQIDRMISKVARFLEILEPHIFECKDTLKTVYAYETVEELHDIPAKKLFSRIDKGYKWGGESHYCWFKSDYTVPKELDGRDIFLRPHVGGYEALLWVDGVPFGTFANKIVFTGHGNHYCDLIKRGVKSGEKIEVCTEYYAGHSYKGCAPLEEQPLLDYDYTYSGFDICVKNDEIAEFYFDLEALVLLEKSLPEESFRRAALINALYEVHNRVFYSYDDVDTETFMRCLADARPFVKKALAVKNGPEAAQVAVIGHSHMDTAWLWHIGETVKKCARTYSNQMSLMEQYPEYTFIQSSACHGDFIRRYYPALFKRLQEKVAQGRYEPNGGVWVECDCNITGGEAMVRQFLWGQRFTRKFFNFTSNCFWLPDTFGYSAAIPQIMKGCGVDYFLTTKIGWNDTNVFPFDTFWWQGIDGTRVFTHFNRTHLPPTPDRLLMHLNEKGGGVGLKEKTVNDKLLVSFGYGDGGGGPQFEQIEESLRLKDLNGCPKTSYTLVGDFMHELEKTSKNPNVYKGELYLELHRGTLTNQHDIKRNNRKAELALRDLEFFTVDRAVKAKKGANGSDTQPLWQDLLINQFHDILPGTCIPRAHKEAKEKVSAVIKRARELAAEYISSDEKCVTLTNTLSFARCGAHIVKLPKGKMLDCDYAQQEYTNLDGEHCVILSGVKIPAFSSVSYKLISARQDSGKAVKHTSGGVETPFAKVKFNKNGGISSFTDKRTGRELVDGLAFNTFLMAEDLPAAWDNWDVDADIESKYRDCAKLVSREVVSEGAAAVVFRSKYTLSEKSSVTQDMFFFADSAEVRFDTLLDWNDDHRFLKTAFDTTLLEDYVRCEVQYGFVRRPTTRNNSIEKAKFEVLNHKYCDLSESRYGVALLNDCKYAISADGGSLRLSLHKGGLRPDFTGDHGKHRCAYSLLPHDSGFCASSVTHPAYELNVPVVVSSGEYKAQQLIAPELDNIIVESIKPCEDVFDDGGKKPERAFIARLYECEGAYVNCRVSLFDGAKSVAVTNMLEEPTGESFTTENTVLTFKPFEIKTLKITY